MNHSYFLNLIRWALLSVAIAVFFAKGVSPLNAETAVSSSENPRAIHIRELYLEGHKREAEKEIKAWMKAEKKNPSPWVSAAEISFYQNRISACIKNAVKAIDKSPAAGDAYYWKARGLEAQKKYLEAVNEYQAAMMAKTTKADVQASLDRSLAMVGSRPSRP